MIRSAVTISLVEEARGGPFVFWDDLPAACRSARALGFDAIELFPPGPRAVDTCMYRAGEIERVLRVGYALARDRRKKLTSVDKANVLATSQLWRRIAMHMAAEAPDVQTEHALVDCARWRC